MKPPRPTDEGTLAGESGSSLDPLRKAAPEPAAAPDPERIGRFLILGRLGEGGMGEVFSAYDPDLDRKVAIKRGRGLAKRSSAAMARVKQEAQALARVSHPNVVHVYEVGECEGRVFIAMEIVDGTSLKDWQEGRDLGEPGEVGHRLRVYLQAATGLLGAHRCGLIHRDFKPDNVLIGKDGRVRVADFGLARVLVGLGVLAGAGEAGGPEGAGEDGADGSGPRLTQAGTILGTPGFMSPEQLRGGEADERSDQFSFCVSLYQSLYGQLPFSGATSDDYARSACAGRVRPQPESPAPRVVQRAILRGLSPDPAARFPSMEGLIAAIESGLDADAASLTARADRTRLVIGIAAWGCLVLLGNIYLGALPGLWSEEVRTLGMAMMLFGAPLGGMLWPVRPRLRRRFRRMMAFFLLITGYLILTRVATILIGLPVPGRSVLEMLGLAALFALEGLNVGWRHSLLALLFIAEAPIYWFVPETRLLLNNGTGLLACVASIYLHTRQPP